MAELYERRGNLDRVAHFETDTNGNERFVIASEMECDAVIAENRRLREFQHTTRKNENFRLAARVPAPIVEKAMQEGWFHDDEAWKRWMNDSDNRDFRVWEGRI